MPSSKADARSVGLSSSILGTTLILHRPISRTDNGELAELFRPCLLKVATKRC